MVRRSPAHEEVLDPFGRLARRAGRVDEGGRAATDGDQVAWDEELTDDDDPFDFEIPPGRAVVSPEARSDGREVLEAQAVLAGAGTAAVVNPAVEVDRGSADRARWPRADPDAPTTMGAEASPSTSSLPQVAPPAWLRLPSALRGATWSPAWTAVLTVVLAVAIAIGVFAVRVALAQAHARPEPVSAGAPSGVSRTAVPSAFASDASAAGGAAAAGGGAAAGVGRRRAARRPEPRTSCLWSTSWERWHAPGSSSWPRDLAWSMRSWPLVGRPPRQS
ncbi:hypothetical protein GCM10025862_08540 [Arsenicicoccus piscis]|uniref:Uncharacterized protein n=1 Tax=Arsenicicoccus piscis TaxID=673954 RepID=A0ABQ6HMD6_9MICO|nr:hypothetical protein GCM10025862_08540 [Arsenicicoccus piscis]